MGFSRLCRTLCTFAPVVLLAVVVCPGPAPAQTPRAERPTFTLGEKWIRSDGLFELIRVEKDLYVFSGGRVGGEAGRSGPQTR